MSKLPERIYCKSLDSAKIVCDTERKDCTYMEINKSEEVYDMLLSNDNKDYTYYVGEYLPSGEMTLAKWDGSIVGILTYSTYILKNEQPLKKSFDYEIAIIDLDKKIVRYFDGNAEHKDSKVITKKQFVDYLANYNRDFINCVIESIKNIGFGAIYYKGIFLNKDTLNEPYFFIAVKTEFLSKIDLKTFKMTPDIPGVPPIPVVDATRKDISAFKTESASGTILIVPTYNDIRSSNYLHFMSFHKNACHEECQYFWHLIGKTIRDALGITGMIDKVDVMKIIHPNTHGFGVNYLHFRLDSGFKYYDNIGVSIDYMKITHEQKFKETQ